MKGKAYWVRRTAALEAAMQEAGNSVSDDIIRAYEKAIESINADIHKTFKAYVATGIPEDEAKKLLNAAEHDKLYQELLQLYEETDDPQTKAEILNRINAQAYGARISRLEGVKARIYIQLRKVGNYAEKVQKTLYTNTLQSSYYTNIYNIAEGLNCGIDFTVLPQRAIDKLLREPWHGKNYSERIWIHNDRFIETVQDTITTGIISGHSVNRMAESLSEYVKEGNDIRSSTEALVRSETSHFMNQGQKSAYEEIGIKKYRYVAALSERTCERCVALDGETFDVDKAVEGENYPPLHPNCRCITIMGDAIPSTRIARDPLTGKNYKIDGNMTFEDWKNSLTDEQRAALKYVDKSAENGIINTGSGKNLMKPDEIIHRSLGAAGKNYPIKLPNGNHAKFAEGTAITHIKVFAGKDTNVPIRDAMYLEAEFGIKAEKWQKMRGEGIIMNNGKPCRAEVHWYEAEGQKEKMKVKRWIDDET